MGFLPGFLDRSSYTQKIAVMIMTVIMNAVRRQVLIFWARQPKPLSLSERQHAPESGFGRLSTKTVNNGSDRSSYAWRDPVKEHLGVQSL
jgi:hypothetical protein